MKHFTTLLFSLSVAFILLLSFNTTSAQITVSFTYTTNGNHVNFSLSTNATGGYNTTWNYGGGVGTSGNGANYSMPGTYYVCVTLIDTFLNTANFCDSVVVPCQAKFTKTSTLLAAQFQNTSFNSGNDYTWDFGDGGPTSNNPSPSHTYALAGSYNVCLTVVDSLTSCTSVYCDSISVISSYQCNANFSYSIISPGKVSIIDKSTANYAAAKSVINFGNGVFFWLSNSVIYQYYVDGTYNVCVTIADSLSNCSSTYCDSISITGAPKKKWQLNSTIVRDSMSTDYPRTYLIKADTISGSVFLTAIDSSDNYYTYFYVEEGTYFLKGSLRSGSQNYSSKLPTYWNNQQLWSNATPIHLTKNTNITIALTTGTNPGGPGFIGGYVSLGANLIPGDPIPGMDVLLFDALDTPVAYSKTDQDGKYSFSNLAYGTYKIYCDILNIPASPVQVTIDADDPSSENNQIEVNSTGVGAPVGIKVTLLLEKENWELYPNPSHDNVMVRLSASMTENVKVKLLNITGDIMFEESFIKLQKSTLSFDISDYSTGIYFVQIISNDKVSTKKLIVQ